MTDGLEIWRYHVSSLVYLVVLALTLLFSVPLFGQPPPLLAPLPCVSLQDSNYQSPIDHGPTKTRDDACWCIIRERETLSGQADLAIAL